MPWAPRAPSPPSPASGRSSTASSRRRSTTGGQIRNASSTACPIAPGRRRSGWCRTTPSPSAGTTRCSYWRHRHRCHEAGTVMWAITGTGLVNCLGADPAAAFAACCRAVCGARPLRAFAADRYRVRVAYEVPDRPAGHRDVTGRASAWLCDVIEQATVRARLPLGSAGAPVLVGTGLAEQRSVELWWTAGADLVLGELNFAGAVSRRFGPVSTTTLVNACSAGLYALAVGTDLLELGEASAVVVAATDSITESMHGLLDRSTPQPHCEIRPFDQARRGVILGEGAAAVVVEPIARAVARGADVLAVLHGVGTSCDAYHATAPSRAGIGRAMRDAYDRSGLQ